MITDEEVAVAIAGLGYSGVAATSQDKFVSPRDLATDVRGALEAFLAFATTGETK